MKNHHKIFVKCRSGRIEVIKALHQVDGGPLMGAQGWGGGKAPEKYCPFNIWRANKQLKIEKA